MSVIPLTLVISLCLVFTFLVFFLREHARSRLSSPERDSMLPFAEERSSAQGTGTPALVISFKDRQPGAKEHHHEHGSGKCSEGKADHERCHDCPSRKNA